MSVRDYWRIIQEMKNSIKLYKVALSCTIHHLEQCNPTELLQRVQRDIKESHTVKIFKSIIKPLLYILDNPQILLRNTAVTLNVK